MSCLIEAPGLELRPVLPGGVRRNKGGITGVECDSSGIGVLLFSRAGEVDMPSRTSGLSRSLRRFATTWISDLCPTRQVRLRSPIVGTTSSISICSNGVR